MLRVGAVVLNVTDRARAARFWRSALGYALRGGEVAAEESATLVDPSGGPALVLDEDDRTHLDLAVVAGGDLAAEVERLVALGARRVPWTYPPGASFVVLADPEGNLFCVVGAP